MKAPAEETQAPNLDLRAVEARQLASEIVNPLASVTESGSLASVETGLIMDTNKPTPSKQATQTLDSTSASAPQSTQTSNANQDGGSGGGLSTGAKAGIAMGALGGILLLFVIVYFVVTSRKKKLEKRKQQIEDDEKINGPFSDKAAAKSPAEAPRLSLRPVTQLWPGVENKKDDKSNNDRLAVGSSKDAHPERRTSRGINLNLSTIPSASERSNSPLAKPANGGSAWERPTVNSTTPTGNRPDTNTSFYSANPFNDGNHLTADEPVSPVSTIDREAAFDAAAGANSKSNTTTKDSTPEPVSPIEREDPADFDAAAAAAAKLERRSSVRQEGLPAPLDLTKSPPPGLNAVPPSPSGTEYSLHSMAPGQQYPAQRGAAEIAAAGGPAESLVHRVQLDFKPTLQDELSLKAGQLVRLLHEYDDGWALCIRLDRSEQGVVPRTCLSTRPVKPRPAGAGPPHKSPLGGGNADMPPPGQAY
ncbi:myosin-1 [Cladorrhinum sp. PSN259]|nr:myosin-1 [Cladorrhinum sp. PSN259]